MTSRITRISVLTHCNELGGKVWNPAIRWTSKYAVFVRIEDQDGNCGIGECWCVDTAPDSLVAFLRTEVIPHLLNTLVEEHTDLIEKMIARATLTARHGILASALSGIDIAMWDLLAQRENQPIWKKLRPEGSGTVALYASGGLYAEGKTPDVLADEMAGHAQRGFKLLKMKIGGETIEMDVMRVQRVLGILPPDARLIIDGVYSYSADDALRIFDALPTDRIEAFQSPTRAWDYAGMARLSRAGIPVMATEAEYRPELHQKLVQETQIAYLQTAPIACGGISRVRALSKLVSDTPTRLSLEVSSTAIALMAACQIAAADSVVAHVEYHTVHTVFFDALDLQINHDPDTRYSLPSDSGLGIILRPLDLSTVYSTGEDGIPPLPCTATTFT